jgi:hypothetical protein
MMHILIQIHSPFFQLHVGKKAVNLFYQHQPRYYAPLGVESKNNNRKMVAGHLLVSAV